MVGTKHCCWGECKSDSRYQEKLDQSLQEMIISGEKAFLPFPKPSQGLDKCQRWINACSRQNFSVKNINRNTYICALHWPGKKGPTKEHPDPLKANSTERKVFKTTQPKRKATQPRRKALTQRRHGLSFKKIKLSCDEKESELRQEELILEEQGFDGEASTLDGLKHSNKETQTEYTKHSIATQTDLEYTETELSSKIETIILKNELKGVPEPKSIVVFVT